MKREFDGIVRYLSAVYEAPYPYLVGSGGALMAFQLQSIIKQSLRTGLFHRSHCLFAAGVLTHLGGTCELADSIKKIIYGRTVIALVVSLCLWSFFSESLVLSDALFEWDVRFRKFSLLASMGIILTVTKMQAAKTWLDSHGTISEFGLDHFKVIFLQNTHEFQGGDDLSFSNWNQKNKAWKSVKKERAQVEAVKKLIPFLEWIIFLVGPVFFNGAYVISMVSEFSG